MKSSGNGKNLKTFYSHIIQLSETEPGKFSSLIDSIKTDIEQKRSTDILDYEKLYLDMNEKYGFDIGLISILFFNLIKLNKNEAIYTPAGLPHAYVRGNIIECMANSDNVIRAGLTKKFTDINNLIELIDYETGKPEFVEVRQKGSTRLFITPAEEFNIDQTELNIEEIFSSENNQPVILLVTEGSMVMTYDKGLLHLHKGMSVFIPAAVKYYKLNCKKKCEFFRAGIKL